MGTPRFGGMSVSPTTKTLLVLALGATSLASEVAGQGPIEARVRLFAGGIDAHGDLPNAPILDSRAVVSYPEFRGNAGAGLGLELKPRTLPIGLRVSAARSLSGQETGVWGCAPDIEGNPVVCPSILIEVPTDITTTLGSAALVSEISVGIVGLHPIVGVGVVRSSYSWDPTSGSGSFPLDPGKHSEAAASLYLGIGMSVPLNGLRLEAEYGEHRAATSVAQPGRISVANVGVSIGL